MQSFPVFFNGPFSIFEFIFLLWSPWNSVTKLCDRMDGTGFWCFPCFPANSLLCVILCYTKNVHCASYYLILLWKKPWNLKTLGIVRWCLYESWWKRYIWRVSNRRLRIPEWPQFGKFEEPKVKKKCNSSKTGTKVFFA